ncbi:MAG: AMP-binding protein [Deferribacteraceae bacterium]|jgi:acyl-CoA synthetase (AMP-forming)/AMP-acid ligase II|nr:AMP-binding protein [Deferribacteraceae bacterium]
MIAKLNELLNNPSEDIGFYRGRSLFAESQSAPKLGVFNAVTYRQFSELVKVYYAALIGRDEKKLVLYVKDSLIFMAAFFASLLADKEIFMPNYYQQDCEELFGAPFTVTDMAEIASKNSILLTDNPKHKSAAHLPVLTEDAKMNFCTSGSTGKPKIISKRLANLAPEAVYLSELFGDAIAQKPLFITTVNINHMYGIFYNFLLPLYNNLAILTDMVVIPDQLKILLSTGNKLFIASSPAFLERLAKYADAYSFPKNTAAISTAGGSLRQTTAEAVYKLFGIYFTEIYGSTETGGIAYRRPDETKYWTLYTPVDAFADENGLLAVSGAFVDSPFSLADRVEFINERQFILKGRSDRIVKFEEKRVSLEEVENVILQNSFIEETYAALIDLDFFAQNSSPFLGACIVLNRAGKDELLAKGKRSFISGIKKEMVNRLDPVCIPSRWRILDELPRNNQGKLITSEIRLLFSGNLAEPVVLEKAISTEKLSLTLSFVKDSLYFRGHFPDFPILAGVVQVNFAISWLKKVFHHETSIKKISKLKFTNIIHPGDIVNLSIDLKANRLYRFKYSSGEKTLSSGELHV